MKKRNLVINRLRIAVYVLLISMVVTLSRLVDIQIIKGSSFQEMADANRTFTQYTPRQRGLVLDRFGNTLVVNEALYYKSLNPEGLYSDKTLIDRNSALQLMATESGVVTMELRRNYLLGPAAGHIIGYTGPVTADDLQKDSDLTTIDLVGKQGLEKIFDTIVRGRVGKDIFEVDALGKKQKLLQSTLGVPGNSLQTTLDPFLTEVAYQAMGNKTGAVVIQDSSSGEVLALVSTPGFDPNLLTMRYGDEDLERARQQSVSESFSHPQQLFFNRALSGAYPPGSVFKLVTAAAGLSSGALDTTTTVEDKGVLEVGEYSYSNWYFTQYGSVEGTIGLQRSIARSNDIFFYKAAEWIGPEKLAAVAREFGFGKRTGIELQSESTGTVPDPAWKEETFGERWYLGNTYHFGIGQGDLSVTPLQVSQMTQAIANRGSLCPPHLIKKSRSECVGLSIMDEDLETIVAGMIDACSTGGTAYPLFPWNVSRFKEDSTPYEAVNNGTIACKTGTAEFGATDERGYKKTHGWFTM
ncbi:MAG: penicillin-binding protein 2, partial [Patescibacteria group bacterium]|nr:penicillin-binding protein 2 [Patescibacteria group bacterium]